jgi:hypothetical protein
LKKGSRCASPVERFRRTVKVAGSQRDDTADRVCDGSG